MTTARWIVGEVSVNWQEGRSDEPGLLCERLERVINVNAARGYRLHSFQLHRLLVGPGTMNETAIAVFERVAEP